jgi:hypothetical protein
VLGEFQKDGGGTQGLGGDTEGIHEPLRNRSVQTAAAMAT